VNTTPDRDHLDELLDQSSPGTTRMTNDVVDELTRLRVATQPPAPRAGVRRKRWARPAAVALAAIVLSGGAATAAATTGLWAPWAETPDGTLNYTLPSGAECELRIGNVNGTDSEAVQAARDFYRETDINALLTDKNIDRTIAQLRTEESTLMNEDGTTEPAGYGTEHYNADSEYDSAVNRIVSDALSEVLARQGIDGGDSSLRIDGEGHCPGAEW
jgi:hypothetical protein